MNEKEFEYNDIDMDIPVDTGSNGSERIDNITTSVGWMERILVLVKKFKLWDFLKAFIVILLLGLVVGFISKPEYFFEKWVEWDTAKHKEKMEIVEKNNSIIHTELESILYKTGADRVLLLSYHNSKQSLAGLPYIYLTAINEAIQYDVKPVAEGYESVKVSLYPMIDYLDSKEYFCGDIEDLRDIDKALAYRMQGNDVRHLCMLHIEGEYPLGVIVCTYTRELDERHNCKDVEAVIRRAGIKIGVLLEQTKKNK